MDQIKIIHGDTRTFVELDPKNPAKGIALGHAMLDAYESSFATVALSSKRVAGRKAKRVAKAKKTTTKKKRTTKRK